MASRRLGNQTVRLENPPSIIGNAAVGGPMEAAGPLGQDFDVTYKDLMIGQKSFEKAERVMMEDACRTAIKKAGLQDDPPAVDFFIAGDLMNQITTSTFCGLSLGIPFLGMYGACSTFCEAVAVGSMLIDGGYADRVLCATASHNATAERQFRNPTEYGGQRKLYAQWTVTGAGALVLAREGKGPHITHATVGKVLDWGVKDPFNQGAAMAPAAVDTLAAHLQDTGRTADYYDLVITGDLAHVGREMAIKLAAERGLTLGERYMDGGDMMYHREKQDVHSGGSGAGCVSSVTCGHFLKEMARGQYKRLLVIATGALLSTTTFQQGENIPAVAHAVAIEV